MLTNICAKIWGGDPCIIGGEGYAILGFSEEAADAAAEIETLKLRPPSGYRRILWKAVARRSVWCGRRLVSRGST